MSAKDAVERVRQVCRDKAYGVEVQAWDVAPGTWVDVVDVADVLAALDGTQ